jgi:DnaJ-class molecular chaperone
MTDNPDSSKRTLRWIQFALMAVIGALLFVNYVPIATCPFCRGTGSHQGTVEKRACFYCMGTGRITLLTALEWKVKSWATAVH